VMSVQVLCLGECLYDRIFDRYDGDRPHTPFWVDYPGGAPANVAVGLAKLGTRVGFIGSLGEDRQGQQLRSILAEAGVDCSGVQRSPKPTRIVLVHRDNAGNDPSSGSVNLTRVALPMPTWMLSNYVQSGLPRRITW